MRPCSVALSALALAACQSPAPLQPLAVRDPFAVAYRGDVAPAVPTEPAAAVDAPSPQAVGSQYSIRAKLLELPVEDGEQAFANLITLPENASSVPSRAEHAVRLPMCGLGGAHVERATIAALLQQVEGRADVVMAPELAASFGTDATVSLRDRTAYVRSVTLRPLQGGLIADPAIDVFETGSTLRFRVEGTKAGQRLVLSWESSEPLRPLPLAATRVASLQVPVVVTHLLSCETAIDKTDSLVVGSLPGAKPGHVQILCVEIDAGEAVAQR